jgi:hypothetical protein
MDTHGRRVWGERRPKDKVILGFTLTCPKTFTFTQSHVSVFDKYLHYNRIIVSVKTLNVNVND